MTNKNIFIILIIIIVAVIGGILLIPKKQKSTPTPKPSEENKLKLFLNRNLVKGVEGDSVKDLYLNLEKIACNDNIINWDTVLEDEDSSNKKLRLLYNLIAKKFLSNSDNNDNIDNIIIAYLSPFLILFSAFNLTDILKNEINYNPNDDKIILDTIPKLNEEDEEQSNLYKLLENYINENDKNTLQSFINSETNLAEIPYENFRNYMKQFLLYLLTNLSEQEKNDINEANCDLRNSS